MKNKKLIATVASLCLVLVAVVAAVIGVLAAASQSFTNTFKVTYTANDVSAVVGLQSRTETRTTYTALAEGTNQKTFQKTDGVIQNVTLSLADEGLTSNNKYAVYKFSFINTNTSYAMTVTPTYTPTETESKVDAGVTVKFQLLASNATPTLPSYASEAVSNTASLGDDLSDLEAFNVAASGEMDLYIIVAITNLNTDAHYYLGGENENTLSFALARVQA